MDGLIHLNNAHEVEWCESHDAPFGNGENLLYTSVHFSGNQPPADHFVNQWTCQTGVDRYKGKTDRFPSCHPGLRIVGEPGHLTVRRKERW